MTPGTSCVMILSDKSSGSTMLQYELGKYAGINRIDGHGRNFESKYWAYATAVLGLPQPKMRYSWEFPVSRRNAAKALGSLFSVAGIPSPARGEWDREAVFGGWADLCRRYAPVFLEKSPHHLHFSEALGLVRECMAERPEVDFRFVGLVRNPMDTLYSMWKRWYAVPERRQFEWLRAYRNLRDFAGYAGDRMMIVRYEDVVSDPGVMGGILHHAGVDADPGIESSIHRESIQKWKEDRRFGFVLDPGVEEFAREYYPGEAMRNESCATWCMRRTAALPRFRLIVLKGRLYRFLRGAGRRRRDPAADGTGTL